jgi:hypothetical protein
METFRVYVAKEVLSSYEVTIDNPTVVQYLEEEKLRSYGYEKSLKLDWDFETYPPKIIDVDKTSSDQTA